MGKKSEHVDELPDTTVVMMEWEGRGNNMRNFIGIFIGITISLSGQAIADVQKCVMRTGQNQNGSIAPEIILIYDEAAKSMQVYDGIIAHFNKEQPVVAKISSQRANNISFGWSVQMVNSQGQRAKMQYQGSLIINLKELHVTARPIGYANVYSAIGVCATYKG